MQCCVQLAKQAVALVIPGLGQVVVYVQTTQGVAKAALLEMASADG